MRRRITIAFVLLMCCTSNTPQNGSEANSNGRNTRDAETSVAGDAATDEGAPGTSRDGGTEARRQPDAAAKRPRGTPRPPQLVVVHDRDTDIALGSWFPALRANPGTPMREELYKLGLQLRPGLRASDPTSSKVEAFFVTNISGARSRVRLRFARDPEKGGTLDLQSIFLMWSKGSKGASRSSWVDAMRKGLRKALGRPGVHEVANRSRTGRIRVEVYFQPTKGFGFLDPTWRYLSPSVKLGAERSPGFDEWLEARKNTELRSRETNEKRRHKTY